MQRDGLDHRRRQSPQAEEITADVGVIGAEIFLLRQKQTGVTVAGLLQNLPY